MLSFTVSPPGSFIYSCYGNFLSPEDSHLVIVKPHSISYFLKTQIFASEEADVELPFETNIIGAYKFTLPTRRCSSIAIITMDLMLIVLSSPESSDDDVPIERIVCDQIRSTHVVPTRFCPLFGLSNNQLFISVYPNSLCIITFGEKSLEKNEIHFTKFLPSFLYGANNILYAFDEADRSIKSIDISNVRSVIDEQISDCSKIFINTDKIEQKENGNNNIDYFYYSNSNNTQYLFNDGKLFIQNGETFDLPNKSNVLCVSEDQNELLISFKDGEFVSFINGNFNKLTQFDENKNYDSITPINDHDILLYSKSEKPIIFNKETKEIKYIFTDKLVNCLTQTVTPHSIPDLQQLVIANKNEIVSFGYGFPFHVESINSLHGERLFSCGEYTLISTHDRTIVLKNSEEIQNSNLIVDQCTQYFYKYNEWYIQCCPTKIIATTEIENKADHIIYENIQVQHATAFANTIAIASSSLKVLKFDGQKFTETANIEIDDEISSIIISKENFLVVSSWKKLSIFVYSVESGEKLSEFKSELIGAKFVVRSICESNNFLFFGTSRGDVICASIDEKSGVLTEVCQSKVSTSTISLSEISIDDMKYVCVSSDITFFIRIENNNLLIYPTNFGISRYISQLEAVDNNNNVFCILGESNVTFGGFESPKIIKITSKVLESPVLRLMSVDSSTLVALLADKLVVFNSLIFELVGSVQLDPSFTYNNAAFTKIGDDLIVAVCAANPQIEKNKFSENGEIIFIKNFNEILNTTIETKGVPTAVVFKDLFLYVSSSSEISKYSISNDFQFTLVKTAPGMMVATEFIVTDTHLTIVDAFKSIAVFDFELHRIATDYLTKYLVAGQSVSDDSYLVSDSQGTVYLLKAENERAPTVSRMSVGETVTGLSRWRPLPNININANSNNDNDNNNNDIFVGSTSKGSVLLFLTAVEPRTFETMAKLQKAMEGFLVSNGELSHGNYRCLYGPSYREPYIAYVDGNFVAGFADLEEEEKAKILAETEVDNIDSVYNLLGLLEHFNIQ